VTLSKTTTLWIPDERRPEMQDYINPPGVIVFNGLTAYDI
jgi:hypothetical protein